MTEKECKGCGEIKPLTEFGAMPRGLGGKRSKCKKCISVYNSQYSKTRIITDDDFRAKKNALSAEWARNNPEKRSIVALRRNKKEMENCPEKVRARGLVNQRVRFGRMPRASSISCCECGEPARHYHHHLGYAFEHRYDVLPVCAKCHTNIG